ncbi:fungal-specific transcription factor domain-containing protein [Talaromyces proteolyticus]|uniref:Fungal-specific transcription factor domain-containing protein n=1 Tax=Talaromyces proteolyticus TaxID=1131652 RepID=A0AAD4PZX5_9EURO|nr:fungal-specific transcription factor domain-containing protein [Talaromyces proteolyticus]KAH8700249.1 fungal-specific transcription factor domain-containing protein [Talaromyces proteolyticus]
MSHFSSFTSRFRARKNITQESPATKVAKRPRESHVCNQCRRSKLRCDRAQPCSSCIKRNDADTCSYRQTPDSKVAGSQATIEGRLAHLETLITDLMRSRELGIPENGDMDPVETSGSPFQDDEVHANSYVGFTHWSAVLDDIHELKAVLGGSAERTRTGRSPLEVPLAPSGELIFGYQESYSLEEIITVYLPSKVDTDRLLSVYFQGETFIVPFIHAYHFQRQYREFWADTQAVNPLWLSMLFSICCLAALIREKSTSNDNPHGEFITQSMAFHTAAGKCLVVGEYHRPQTFAVESLAIYAQSKSLKTLDPCREAGAILGMVIRLAYEMGYHRDPDSVGSLTVFEGEMRRRFWAACKQVDVMTAFQLGLPSNICLENCDTKSPRNLLDSDFDTDTQVLPPSRSENEATKLLWFVIKDRQLVSFSKVCQDALSFKENSESEILQLDEEVRQMHTTVPDILRTRPFSESIADESFLVMTRIYIEFIYLKSLCILHRKYMARGNAYSAKTCVEVGTQLVGQFIDMYKEISPGGRLHAERWMLTSFTMNDYLLGIMVLCLVVHTYRKGVLQPPVMDSSKEREILQLLEQSFDICMEKSSVCKDAKRVSHVVHLILNSNTASNPSALPHFDNTGPGLGKGPISLEDEHSNKGIDTMAFDFLDPFSLVGNGFENLDWFSFDPQL